MKDNKKFRIVGKFYGNKVPEGEEHMEYINKMNSALRDGPTSTMSVAISLSL